MKYTKRTLKYMGISLKANDGTINKTQANAIVRELVFAQERLRTSVSSLTKVKEYIQEKTKYQEGTAKELYFVVSEALSKIDSGNSALEDSVEHALDIAKTIQTKKPK